MDPATPLPDLAQVLADRYIDSLDLALWVYDIDHKRVLWANAAALRVWNAPDIETLRARDLGADMSRSVAQRLRQYQEDFLRRDAIFHEAWTLYPLGVPKMLRVKYRGFRLPDGRMAMLCEGLEETEATPEALRSVEALLHTSVAISLFALTGEMLYCNPAARACYGGGVTSLAARFVETGSAEALLAEVSEKGMFERSMEVHTLGGDRWHQLKAYLCRDAVTGEPALLLSETDVTETHLARLALVASRNEALEASRLKTEFVANMSHEIRTPLNGVLGIAQLLQRTALSPEQAELVAMIESSGKALLGIIEDILDISKIEAGQIEIEAEPFDVLGVVREAADTVFVAASAKSIAVVQEMPRPIHDRVVGDAKRLRQVLINLLGNAIKFSRDRDVVLRVEPQGRETLRFAVIDQGIGIPRDQQQAIFERFRQADGSLSRSYGGTGLGLAICKMLVEMMGGEIGVSSTVGEGSTFWFTIHAPPLSNETPQPEHREPPEPGDFDAEGVRILLAEDNPTNQFIIARSLERRGFAIDIASNGREALERLEHVAYALVLMDIQMPVMSGFEAIEAIRSGDTEYADIPIIALTTNATPAAMLSVLEIGATAYMTKPVNLDELVERVSLLARPPMVAETALRDRRAGASH